MSVNKLVLWSYIKEHSIERRDHIVMISGDRRISYGELDEASDKLAKAFLKLGVGRGDVVATLLPPCVEYVYVYVAAAKIGAVLLPLDLREKPPDLIGKTNELKAKIFITLNNFAGVDIGSQAISLKRYVPSVEYFILSRGMPSNAPENYISFEKLFEEDYREYDDKLDNAMKNVDPDDAFLIIYTGGTTGKPKGAVLTQKSCILMSLSIIDRWRITDKDVLDLWAPPSHVGGSTEGLLTALISGMRLIIIEYYRPDVILKNLEKHKVTIHGGVPTTIQMETSLPNFNEYDRSSLRLIAAGGGFFPPELMDKVMHYGPNVIGVNTYGLTEASGYVTLSTPDDPYEIRLRSVGKPVKNVEVKIVDDDGNKLSSRESGEIFIKGSIVMKSYLNDEESKKVFTEDRWLKTGDIGYLDENGYLYLIGRKKLMYKTAGYSVYPERIENYLIKHPNILLAAVIGVSDKVYGTVGIAFVVPKPGVKLTEDDLKKYCEKSLAEYEVPRKFIIRESLPLTSLGKIDKPKLMKELE